MKLFIDNGQEFKYCPQCDIIYPYPESLFNIDNATLDKLCGSCRDCRKEYFHIPKNYEKQSIKKKQYYEDNKERLTQCHKQWYKNNKEKASEYRIQRRQTPKGKLDIKRYVAKRNRKLGWIPLFNNPFPEEVKIHWHHINDMLVVPIPMSIHQQYYGNNHREKLEIIIKNMYGLDM